MISTMRDSRSELPSKNDDAGAMRVCRIVQVLIVLVATLMHGIFLSKAKPLQSANDRSRWCTVWSLVERGTFMIDEIRQRPGWDTIDLVHVDGHFYSTKPPLLTAIVAGITWSVQEATGWKLAEQTQSVTFVVLLMTNLVPFVISLIVWIAIVDLCNARPLTRIFTLTIAAFGTMLTPFLMVLNNHTVAAASTMVALFALLKILNDDRASSAKWPFLLCGIAVAWSAVNELPAASFAAIVFFLLLAQSAKKTLAYFLPAAAIPVAALILTNIIATGSWKPVYANYGSEKYRFVIDGVPSYWMHPQGVDRNLDTPLAYFIHCTVGHHGLFSLTPIMILALAGWLSCSRMQDRALRIVMWVGAATSTIVIAFYMTRTQNYNYGGVSCALRWALWLTPLWLLAMVPICDVYATSKRLRSVAVLLSAISVYSAWEPIDNPWRQPWLIDLMENRGWIDYSEDPPPLERPLWTWFASLPVTSIEDPAWIEFSVAQSKVSSRYVRLTGRPDRTAPTGERMELEIRETVSDETTPARIRTLLIDIEKFNNGAPPADFLNWTDPNITETQQQADLAFVRGLPRKVPYEAKAIRYLKSPLRHDAFKCQLAAAHVAFAAKPTESTLAYRCEAWLTNEVPFGVVQIDFHVSQPENNVVLFHERWTMHDCWPKPK